MFQYPKVRIVDRTQYIVQRCRGKKVLDLGCASIPPPSTNLTWLHAEIKKVAQLVHGVDIDKQLLRLLKDSGENHLYHCNVENLENLETELKYDVIVASELIEHLNNPGLFLKGVKQIISENGILLIATPNAYGIKSFLMLLLSNAEPSPISHTCYFSYATLNVLLNRFGFYIDDIAFFHWAANKFYSKIINYVIELLPFAHKFADHFIITARPIKR